MDPGICFIVSGISPINRISVIMFPLAGSGGKLQTDKRKQIISQIEKKSNLIAEKSIGSLRLMHYREGLWSH
jgi:hypothetical protein